MNEIVNDSLNLIFMLTKYVGVLAMDAEWRMTPFANLLEKFL